MLDLKGTEALAETNSKFDKAKQIKEWFINFQDLLRRIFDDGFADNDFSEYTIYRSHTFIVFFKQSAKCCNI